MTLAKYEPQLDLAFGERPVFPWAGIPHPGAPVLIGVGCALFAPTVFGAATPIAMILLCIGSLNDVIFVSKRMATESTEKTVNADYVEVVDRVDHLPAAGPSAPTVERMDYAAQPEYTQPNPWSTIPQERLDILDEQDRQMQRECLQADVPVREYLSYCADAVMQGIPRLSPSDYAASRHPQPSASVTAESLVQRGVEPVGSAVESRVGGSVEEVVVEPLRAPVEAAPVIDYKQKVIDQVQRFKAQGGLLSVNKIEEQGSNESRIIRAAAHPKVKLSLYWLSQQFDINRGTKSYEMLQNHFERCGGKVGS